MTQPAIADTVHYVADQDGTCKAAIVTETDPVKLVVFWSDSIPLEHTRRVVTYDGTNLTTPHSWHYATDHG